MVGALCLTACGSEAAHSGHSEQTANISSQPTTEAGQPVSGLSRAAIEQAVAAQFTFPKGSEPPAAYSRYFAVTDAGQVQVGYLVVDDFWVAMIKEECRAKDAPAYPCKEADLGIPPAGKSYWAPSPDDMPGFDDGGCRLINAAFDPKSGKLSKPECNGARA